MYIKSIKSIKSINPKVIGQKPLARLSQSKTITYLFFMLLFVACNSNNNGGNGKEVTNDVSYQASDALFPNPERGFYKYSETNLGSNPRPIVESTLSAHRANNITLLFRYFYLKEFRDRPLTQAALNQIDADLAVIRAGGMKCIMRYTYSSHETEPDAPLDIILQHLEQLKPVLEKNADVIAVLQAGFIGAWGEWYYTSNNLNNPTARTAILDKMLEVLPERRMVQVRTPAYKTEYLKRNTPLSRAEAFSGSKAARLGHHNDCFMASTTDYGTYVNIEAEKTYISNDALYVPIGGETCPPSGITPADCQKAQSEMQNLRWTYLNEDYYRGVNDRWATMGCMDNIKRNLGYRFVLHSATYTTEVSAGGTLNVHVKLHNVGYASLYNPRKVEFVLRNDDTGEEYIAKTDEDPRFWRPQVVSEIKLSMGVPKDMPVGLYYLYLHLPDPEPELYGNPDFSIQFANKNVWEAETGYNNLYQLIEIKTSSTATYKGNVWFQK